MKKNYKPGQIITIDNKRYRIKKSRATPACFVNCFVTNNVCDWCMDNLQDINEYLDLIE